VTEHRTQGKGGALRTNVSEQCQESMIELHGQAAWDRAVHSRAATDAAGGRHVRGELTEEEIAEAFERR
jgi:hypothetical protein